MMNDYHAIRESQKAALKQIQGRPSSLFPSPHQPPWQRLPALPSVPSVPLWPKSAFHLVARPRLGSVARVQVSQTQSNHGCASGEGPCGFAPFAAIQTEKDPCFDIICANRQKSHPPISTQIQPKKFLSRARGRPYVPLKPAFVIQNITLVRASPGKSGLKVLRKRREVVSPSGGGPAGQSLARRPVKPSQTITHRLLVRHPSSIARSIARPRFGFGLPLRGRRSTSLWPGAGSAFRTALC